MSFRNACIILALIAGSFLVAIPKGIAQFDNQHMVVANRAGASISIVDVLTNGVTTIPMPPGVNTPEPMYITYSPANDVVFVGDRANNRVVAFNARTYAVVNPGITVPAGVFHMDGSAVTNRLWVVSDTSRQLSVIDMLTFTNLGSRPTPADLGANAAPHDIVVEPDGSSAYITVNNTSSPTNDNVVKYSNAPGFPESDRASVGKGVHVALTGSNNLLYVPSEGSDRMDVLSRSTLDPAAPALTINNSHGVAPTEDGTTLYNSTFPGDGLDGLHVISTSTNALINSVDTPNGPHNLAVSRDDTRLYITHSGPASTLVSIFDISGAFRDNPQLLTTVNVGLNPFGISSVPTIPEPATSLLGIATVIFASLLRGARSTGVSAGK